MICDVANWIQTTIINNPQVLKSLIALGILIGAAFLMFGKPTKKILSKRLSGRIAGAALFVLGAFVFLRAYIADLADVFTVWATIVLAGVAVFSFEESRRLRKQYKEREERDRDERLLNEIIEWAISITKCESESPMTVLPLTELVSFEEPAQQKVVEYINRFDRVQLMRRYQAIDARSESIKIVAKKLDKSLGSNLHSAVRTTAKKLATNIVISNKRLKGEATDQEYDKHWHSLVHSAVALSKKASSLID